MTSALHLHHLADSDTIRQLARLDPIEYERARDIHAAALGIRVTALDKLVKAARKGDADDNIIVNDCEPWQERIEDGAQLLTKIVTAIRRGVSLSAEQADVVALWCVYTHIYDAWSRAPRLGIRAPAPECGKSELLLRVERLAARSYHLANPTPAAFFRLIDKHHPTMCWDEADGLGEFGRDLIHAMNEGWMQDGKIVRCIGDNHELTQFKVFGPFAYAMIVTTAPPGAFDSRSIVIEMRRSSATEQKKLVELEGNAEEEARFRELKRKAARWATDNREQLAAMRPDMAGLIRRPALNWRPLFAIADLAGGDWPNRIRLAAAKIAERKRTLADGEEVLADIKIIFEGTTLTELSSADLVGRLVALAGRPWGEYGRNQKPLTPKGLADLLRPFDIGPENIGPEDHRVRGYRREWFAEAFTLYVQDHPPLNRTYAQDAENKGKVEPENSGLCTCADEKGVPPKDTQGAARPARAANGDRPPETPSGDPGDIPQSLRRCDHCGESGRPRNPVNLCTLPDRPSAWLHRGCEKPWGDKAASLSQTAAVPFRRPVASSSVPAAAVPAFRRPTG
jgi:hypothetical protein